MSNADLQTIADAMLAKVQSKMLSFFTDFEESVENTRREVEFVGSKKVSYPGWLLDRTGKKLVNAVYPAAFSPKLNRDQLFRALKRVNLLPLDLRDKFVEIRSSIWSEKLKEKEAPNRSIGARFAIVRFSGALSNQKFPFADPAALNLMTTPPLPEQIELHRDRLWRRDEDLRVESAVDAERFIEDVGFANTLTDTRRAGPSLRHLGMR